MYTVATILSILLGVDVAVMLLARQYWVFELFINFVPQFLFAAMAGFVLLVFQKRFFLAGAVMIAIVYFGWPFLFLWSNPGTVSAQMLNDADADISFVQVNVNYDNRKYAALISAIQKEEPTIITINEATDVWTHEMKTKLSSEYPYEILRPADTYRGMAVFSKVPMTLLAEHVYSGETPLILEIDVNGLFTLFVAHPVSPVSKSWAEQRNGAIEFLGKLVAATSGDVIVSGDFNTTIHSPVLRNFVSQAKLAVTRQGFGWKPNWMRHTPLAIAIDYIFYRPGMHFQVVDFDVMPDIGSDHWPIFARFVVKL